MAPDAVSVAGLFSYQWINPYPKAALSVASKKGCIRCGKPKKSGPGVRLCETCMPIRYVKGCSRCGAEKAIGRGTRLCEKCKRTAHAAPRPCLNCGARTPKVRGRKLCDECRTYVPDSLKRRRDAKRALKRQPCLGCQRPKGPGSARKYCDRCLAEAAAVAKACRRCKVKPVRPGAHNKLCTDCKNIAVAAHKKQLMVRHAERFATEPEYRARIAERQTRSAARRRKARKAEARKLKSPVRHRGVSLPGEPLAKAVRALAIRETSVNPYARVNGQDLGGRLITVCKRAGIADRSIRRWEEGERVSFAIADKVCQGLGLEWWNVWTLGPEPSGSATPLEVLRYIGETEDTLSARAAFG